ncbi:MAG: hypothetical protein IKR11_09930 [Solobacterium sp.]|nr:hypothetical protein [Solobacterium sp.]
MKNTLLTLTALAICYTAIDGCDTPKEDPSYNYTTNYEDNSSTTYTTNIFNTTYRDSGYMYTSDDLVQLVTSYYYRDHSADIQLYYSAEYNDNDTYTINLMQDLGDHYYIWASYQVNPYGNGYDLINNPEQTMQIDFVTNTTTYTPSQNTTASYETTSYDYDSYDDNTYDYTSYDDYSYDDDTQTAPMPDHEIQISEILGKWSPDINAAEPEIIEFYLDNGVLKYDYYTILLGNGNGFNIKNETTKFEYNNGLVSFYGNQGNCYCLGSDNMTAYISFYLDQIAYGYITVQRDGEIFYRVYD